MRFLYLDPSIGGRGARGLMLMVTLAPIPEETVSLAEQVEQLRSIVNKQAGQIEHLLKFYKQFDIIIDQTREITKEVVKEETKILVAKLETQTARVDDAFEAIDDLENQLTKQVKNRPSSGEKTHIRILKIDEVLKAHGPTTLRELRRILNIDKATMTRLLGTLDKRRYEIFTRSGDNREKVLRLRSQIR